MIKIPKGTKDVLPNESFLWQYLELEFRKICSLYNIKEIRTPTFERAELFLQSVGEDTDVNKEMYVFYDKKNRMLCLKPEGTACVARAFIENNLNSFALPLKLYYITPVFRYENPQKGRYREHHQLGVEFFGCSNPNAEVEIISFINNFFDNIKLNNYKLEINSLGCSSCRTNYIKDLKIYFDKYKNNLCNDCNVRLNRNVLRILDCKNEKCKQIIYSAPVILDFLCNECLEKFNYILDNLKKLNINYHINPHIVRGLDYYTGTVFEYTTTKLGAQASICGGGRYDNLVKKLGGNEVSCVGVGIGEERLLELIKLNYNNYETNLIDIFIAFATENEFSYVKNLCLNLRKKGKKVEYDLLNRNVKNQLKYADKIKAKYCTVIGGDEIKNSTLKIRNMKTREERICNINEIDKYV